MLDAMWGSKERPLGTTDPVPFSRWDGEVRREEGDARAAQGDGGWASPGSLLRSLPGRDPGKWRRSLRCRGTSPPGSRQTQSHPGTRVGETGRGRGGPGLCKRL